MRLASHYSKKTWSMIYGVEEEEDSLFFPFSNFYILFSLFLCLHIFFPYLSLLSGTYYTLYSFWGCRRTCGILCIIMYESSRGEIWEEKEAKYDWNVLGEFKRKGGTFGKCVPNNVLGRIMIPDTSSLGSSYWKNESSEKKSVRRFMQNTNFWTILWNEICIPAISHYPR